MIPERATLTVDSTVKGEDVAMSIDQSALAHIMNVLTDLYADPELAVIREYSTNALDSHVEAGQTRPIEVTTPTSLRPVFSVRDYGVGLDADDIRDIYSRYGASTKRASNDAVGMLGLGCKSALAYVDQFTLAGIKDGHRILVSIARDESGAGTMTVLEAGPTDEADGVEVSIPVNAYSDLDEKAQDFFSYWEPGTVLLNGETPNELSGFRAGDFIVADFDKSWQATGTSRNRLTVVMGNVSYPPPEGFESDILAALPGDRRLVVRVPIGAVHFTPSREGLQDSERTRSAIHEALAPFPKIAQAAAKEAIQSADSKPAAARAMIEARRAFGNKMIPEMTWEGESIPTVLSAEDCKDPANPDRKHEIWKVGTVRGYRGAQSYRAPAGQISLDDAGKNPWVTGFDNATWTTPMRRKLNRYMEHHELSDAPAEAVLFVTTAPAVPRPDWIDGAVTAIAWADVRTWKDPLIERAQGSNRRGKYAGTYSIVRGGCESWQENFPADSLPKSGRNLYYMGGGKCTERQMWAANLLSKKAILVRLPDARMDKFMRLFPHARDAVEAVTQAANGWLASLSEDQRAAIALEGATGGMIGRSFSRVHPDKLDDPELARLIRITRLWLTTNLRDKWADRKPFASAPTLAECGIANWKQVYARYPLVDNLGYYAGDINLEHAVLYVNAVYAANTNKEES